MGCDGEARDGVGCDAEGNGTHQHRGNPRVSWFLGNHGFGWFAEEVRE
jgi:hypothetical protein